MFPGGGRLRPQLCLVAAVASGDARPLVADAAAASIELLHCASLVHDDLPCFDDAPTRRGRPTVHKVYGQAIALLVGDAFIVQSFDVLTRAVTTAPKELIELLSTLASAAGTTRGLLAGQAWESEPAAPLDEYHSGKTASLFEAAAALGAIAAGANAHPWRQLGYVLGRAYQAADDLDDALGCERALGKPVGRDAALRRPNLVAESGVAGARARLASWLDRAHDEVPDCEGQALARAWVERFSARLRAADTEGSPRIEARGASVLGQDDDPDPPAPVTASASSPRPAAP